MKSTLNNFHCLLEPPSDAHDLKNSSKVILNVSIVSQYIFIIFITQLEVIYILEHRRVKELSMYHYILSLYLSLTFLL